MPHQKLALQLLPYPWKYAGISLVSLALVLVAWYLFFDFRLELPVFAVYSKFFQEKFFAVFTTNVADEIIMVCMLTGCLLLVFSAERDEQTAFNQLRLLACFDALKINGVFLLFAILFVYGSGFVIVMLINMVSLLLIYLLCFGVRKRKLLRAKE